MIAKSTACLRFSQAALLILLGLFLAASALSLQGAYLPYEDDTYIYLRYSRNLAAGLGPVWNPGDAPVEGYTSVLYQGVLVATEVMGWDSIARSGWIGIGLSLLTLALTWQLANRLNPQRPLLNLLAPLLLSLSKDFQYWTTAGMETPLYILLLVAATLITVNWLQRRGPAWAVGLLWALAALARPEALILFGLTVVFALVGRLLGRQERMAEFAAVVGVFLAVQLPYQIGRWLVFGYPFPNTYYAKTGGGAAQISGGFHYVATSAPGLFEVGWLSSRWPALTVALPLVVILVIFLGILVRPRDRVAVTYLGVMALGSLLVVVYNGGDHFMRARFLVPILPFVAILLVVAAAGFLEHRAARLFRLLSGVALVLLVIGWGHETARKVGIDWDDFRLPADQIVPPANGDMLTTLDLWGVGFILMGQKLAEIATPDQSIAVVPIGSIGYFSNMHVLDMVGVVDPVIAHEPMDPAYTASWRPGHDKGDGQYILSLEPDFIQLLDRLTSQPHPGPDTLSLRYKSIVEILASPAFEELYEFCAIPMPGGWYYNLYRRRSTTGPCKSLLPPATTLDRWSTVGAVR